MSVYLPRWRQLIAEQELALARCDTQSELEDCWFSACDHFPDGSKERLHLQSVYAARLKVAKRTEAQRSEVMRLARAS